MTPPELGNLLVRADASASIGTGHWMRCLALSQAWHDAGGAVVLAAAEGVNALEQRFEVDGIDIVRIGAAIGSLADAAATAGAARDAGAQWVALDGYHFDAAYRARLKDVGGANLLCLDDDGRNADACTDIVLNQNLSAASQRYPRLAPGAQRLLGPDFVLLRREFGAWRGKPKAVAVQARRVLVTLGGGDAGAATECVVAGLASLPQADLEAVVLLPAARTGQKATVGAADARIQLIEAVDGVSSLMAWADVAVAAGGTTCLELAFMGLPALLLQLAENQRANVAALEEHAVARALGSVATVTAEDIGRALTELLGSTTAVRGAMSARGCALVDGHGARRTLSAMRAHDALVARPATAEDAGDLFEWANDQMTRAMSFDQRPVEWETHGQWLAGVLASHDRRLFVVEWREAGTNTAFGQVRLDADGTVSFGLAPAWRGRGLAAAALRKALAHPAALARGGRFVARIKPDNEASRRAFRQAGFALAGTTQTNGAVHEQWVMEAADA